MEVVMPAVAEVVEAVAMMTIQTTLLSSTSQDLPSVEVALAKKLGQVSHSASRTSLVTPSA